MKTIPFLLALAGLAHAQQPPEADRAAILAMAGKFKVQFHFAETLAFQPNYELTKPYVEDAYEWVTVAEDTGRRIALQHLLVVGDGKRVVHHWRQIWTYEDTRVTQFQAHNAWKTKELAPDEARGTWTQLVTQVDNSPRYESWGRWNHEGGAARWVSADTWRPLPRREHTKRSDYDAISGTNTHLITAQGWAHEQDNLKLAVRDGQTRAIARERGLNTYTRDEKFDFSPAEKFWVGYRDFSNAVARAWDEVTAREGFYRLEDDIETSGLRDEIKDLAKLKLAPEALGPKIHATIAKYLRNSPATAQQSPTKAPAAGGN
jgi:hypothetical protein